MKSSIDRQRESAITLNIGGDDKSEVKEFLSTSDALYVIKETSVFKIQLADDIDPARTNPNIPNLSQQILTQGHDNEIVARILLTAKYLFDEKNATVKPFIADLFKSSLVLTEQILELYEMTQAFADEINKKEKEFLEKPMKPNGFTLPSVSGIATKMHNILSKADKAKDTILEICRLQFLPGVTGKIMLEKLEKAISEDLKDEPDLILAWQETAKFYALIRNTRNASEHPKPGYKLELTDFAMRPDGAINPPLIEIVHPDTPIRTLPITEFLEFIQNLMLAYAENTMVFIRYAALLKNNPFNEWVAAFPEEERRHKHVQFYRAININDQWRILG
jgi:hypothetical protein